MKEEKENIDKKDIYFKEKILVSEILPKTEIMINDKNELESISHSVSRFEYDEQETSKYYYNDKINEDYKPSDFRKQYKIESYSFIGESPTKNFSQKRDRNKSILKSKIIKDINELDFILRNIHKNKYKINLNLLYKASSDGDKSSIFHEKCDKAQTTLVLIETINNKKFGGYTKRTWRGLNIKKSDSDSFIFSLDKKKIYNAIKGKKVIGCFNDLSPYFLGAFKIYDNSFIRGGCLLKNEKIYEIDNIEELIFDENDKDLNETESEINFEIEDIEVYEIKIA